VRVETGGPEHPGVLNVGVEVFNARIEVVELALRAVKDVQSYGPEGAIVVLAVLADVHALHEA
jgi:hypothetical protein